MRTETKINLAFLWGVVAGIGAAAIAAFGQSANGQGFCFTGGHGRIISERVVGSSYQQPVHQTQKQVIVDDYVDDYRPPQNYQSDGDLVGALGTIAQKQQEQKTLLEGLRALGFASTASAQYSQPQPQRYVPYAEAPYEQGTTAYSVRNVEVDAFGPQDVREIVAAVSRYSTQANAGANQLMSQAQEMTGKIADSVDRQAETALRVATIDAETRATEATAEAITKAQQGMLEALKATRPQQQTRVRVQDQAAPPEPPQGPPPGALPAQPEANRQSLTRDSVALLREHCVDCHSPSEADPPGGFRLSSSINPEQFAAAAQAVLSGSMPKNDPLPMHVRAELVAELQQLVH